MFCGLGGWAEGFLAEGYDVDGYDIEAHQYGEEKYPGRLQLADVRNLNGAKFAGATVIVASPPCQEYSYRAMPWGRAKALPPPDNTLFHECFRIQREASAAAGRHIPLIVENVWGAQKWVGYAAGHYGSFFLWGDVPALLPVARSHKVKGQNWNDHKKTGKTTPHWRLEGLKVGSATQRRWSEREADPVRGLVEPRHTKHLTNPEEHQDGLKLSPRHVTGKDWFDGGPAAFASRSSKRKRASAIIAKIPLPLSLHIARAFKP